MYRETSQPIVTAEKKKKVPLIVLYNSIVTVLLNSYQLTVIILYHDRCPRGCECHEGVSGGEVHKKFLSLFEPVVIDYTDIEAAASQAWAEGQCDGVRVVVLTIWRAS